MAGVPSYISPARRASIWPARRSQGRGRNEALRPTSVKSNEAPSERASQRLSLVSRTAWAAKPWSWRLVQADCAAAGDRGGSARRGLSSAAIRPRARRCAGNPRRPAGARRCRAAMKRRTLTSVHLQRADPGVPRGGARITHGTWGSPPPAGSSPTRRRPWSGPGRCRKIPAGPIRRAIGRGTTPAVPSRRRRATGPLPTTPLGPSAAPVLQCRVLSVPP